MCEGVLRGERIVSASDAKAEEEEEEDEEEEVPTVSAFPPPLRESDSPAVMECSCVEGAVSTADEEEGA